MVTVARRAQVLPRGALGERGGRRAPDQRYTRRCARQYFGSIHHEPRQLFPIYDFGLIHWLTDYWCWLL